MLSRSEEIFISRLFMMMYCELFPCGGWALHRGLGGNPPILRFLSLQSFVSDLVNPSLNPNIR